MAKQLNINLGFTADTTAAKQAVKDLQISLTSLINNTALKIPNFQLTTELQQASQAAAALKISLQNATNVDTGRLDLTKFNDSLKQSGMTLAQYQNALYSLGPAGEKAFADVARAITLAEVPLKRSNVLLDQLWTTMKNTARWQLTSSALHSFVGALQTAYHYAEDLNESLNNIRIVTGYSVDKMTEFADEANRAAKALSTTTTEYTNASLIYYQQGLNTQEVKERTDLTIKMANVARVNAETASDQLTAIWNNFDNGTKSLEYYVDVMTALGAKTASSTDEIAGGLEKFAAIADTIGLSYEYATAALTTLTSNTRESEEVIGTALKTIFARMQGLRLGETLEDGVTLNHYSDALRKIGVNILDQNGDLVDMDNILDGIAEKWNILSRAQQTALAQTVAGVRQYTQLIALMENWDKGDEDSFVANVATARNASGALQEQADIYAESWEAANNRVKASAETVYQAILNDEFFIDLTNVFADLLVGVDQFIDGLGGVKGVLLALGSIVTNVFSKQISQALSNAAYSIKMLTPKAREKELETKAEANNLLIQGAKDSGTLGGGYRADVYSALGKQQLSYIQNASRMSQEEQQINQIIMDRHRLLANEVIAAGDKLQKTQEQIILERKHLAIQAQVAAGNNKDKSHGGVKAAENIEKHELKVEQLYKSYSLLNAATNKLDVIQNIPQGSEEFTILSNSIQQVIRELAQVESFKTPDDFHQLALALGTSNDKAEDLWKTLSRSTNLSDLHIALSDLTEEAGVHSAAAIDQLRKSLQNCTGSTDQAENMLNQYLAVLNQFGPESLEASEALQKLQRSVDRLDKTMSNTIVKPITISEAFTRATSAAMALGQVISSLQGIINVFNDETSTASDKLMAIVSSVSMLIPALASLKPALDTVKIKSMEAGAAGAAAAGAAMWEVTLVIAAIGALTASIVILIDNIDTTKKQLERAEKAAEQMAEAADNAKIELEALKAAFDDYDTVVDKLDNCTKGTQEWQNALEEVNKTVRELLIAFPSLAQNANLLIRDLDTGLLSLNPIERDDLITQMSTLEDVTQSGSMLANLHRAEVQQQYQSETFSKSVGTMGVGQRTYASGKFYYDQNLDLGQILVDNATNLAATTTDEEYRNVVKELLLNNANDLAKSYVGFEQQINDIIDTSIQYRSAIQDLADGAQDVANQLENTANLIAEDYLGDTYGAAEKAYAAEIFEREQKRIAQEWTNKLKGKGIGKISSGAKNTIYQDALQLLNEAGYNLSTHSNAVRGTDTNRSLAFLTSEGKEVVYNAEQVAAMIAAKEALEALGAAANEVTVGLVNLDDSWGSEVGNAARNLIANGNLDQLTAAELMALNQSDIPLSVASFAQSMGISEDKLLQGFGVESEEEFYNLWTKAINNLTIAFENAGQTITNSVQEAYKQLDSNNLNVGEKNKLAELLDTAYLESGNLEALSQTYKKVAVEQQDELVNALSEVNWNTVDIETLRNHLEKFGITTIFTDSELQTLIDSMYAAANTAGLSAEAYTALKDLSIGDILSSEDFNKYAQEYNEYFRHMADGTYQLTVDAEEFYQVVAEGRKKALYGELETTPSVVALKSYGDKLGLGTSANNYEKLGLQLDYLSLAGYADSKMLQEWQALLRGRELTQENADAITEAVATLLPEWDNVIAKAEESEKVLASQILSTTKSLTEFSAETQLIAQELGLDALSYNIVAQGLQMLAVQYDNTANELLIYQQALAYGTEAEIQVADANLRLAISVGEVAKEYDLNANAIERQVEQLQKLYNLEQEDATRLTVQNVRMNKGLTELIDSWEEQIIVLTEGDKASSTYADTITSVEAVLHDIIGISDDFVVSTTFIANNLDLITEAAQGSVDAITQLSVLLAQEQLIEAGASSGRTQALLTTYAKNIINGNVQEGTNIAKILSPGQADILVELINDLQLTPEELDDLLNSLGLSGTITQEDIPTLKTEAIYDESGQPIKYKEVETTKTIGKLDVSDLIYVGTGTFDPSILEAVEDVKEVSLSEIERYKAINDQLDELADAYDDAAKAADRLYGKDRLEQIDKQNNLLRDEIALLEEKREKAENTYLPDDRKAVDTALAAFNLTDEKGNAVKFEYDANGIITNYRNILLQARKAAEGDETKSEQFQTLLDAIEQYDATRELIRDINNEIRDTNNLIQDNNYAKLTEALNYKLEVTNEQMQNIEYSLSKVEDDFYAMAEAAALMAGGLEGSEINKLSVLGSEYAKYINYLNELGQAFYNTDGPLISEADYVEGLKKGRDAMYEQLEALKELDDAMLEYYGNTLAAAGEEIGKYVDKVENLGSVLDHYSSLLKTIGKEQNYKAMGIVLEGVASNMKDQADIAKAEYDFYQQQILIKQEALKGVKEGSAAYELLKGELEAVEQAAAQSYDNVLAKTNAWAESMKAVVENQLSDFGQTLEEALTGGLSFDELSTSLDHAVSLQEEYLTATNQIYETTKLMRTAQQAIDASTNATVKQKLKNFVAETAQLQNQSELSKYELEIQQAKYDLLLAEIALEDAQNAKSMVRLQRDSEGNFGYVYTADQNAVNNAQQGLEDAQNSLYNIALEGAENYTTKYQETLSNMYNELTELQIAWLNGEITSQEEYDRKVEEIQEFHYAKLQDFAKLYQVAITTDNRVVRDSWSTDFADMTMKTEEWKTNVSTYLSQCGQAFTTWDGVVQSVEATTGKSLGELATKVNAITTESQNLVTNITGENGVISALQEEANEVSQVTLKYAEQRDTIQEVIDKREANIKKIEEELALRRQLEENVTLTNTNNNETDNDTDDNTEDNAQEISKGAIVRVKASAETWANGKTIASYVKGNDFEVLGVYGDEIAIGNPNGPNYTAIGYTGRIKKSLLKGFASGGYTGEWGPEGKLAMLHQKELVLNQQDTSNILAAVEMLRVILDTLDIHTMSAQVGGFLSSPNYYGGNDNSLNQNVTIEASFPGVTDRYELEEAFHNLINKASQYANRK